MGIYDVRKAVNEAKKENNYFVIDNLKVDLRNLKAVHKYPIGKIESNNYNYTYEDSIIPKFDGQLQKYCNYLCLNGVPFDSIEVISEAGLIISRAKYDDIIRDYMTENLKNGKEDKKLDWSYFDSEKYINNLKIEDTLEAIPINFTYIPKYTYDKRERKSFNYLGKKDNYVGSFHTIVYFDELVRVLESSGYKLRYKDEIINSYDDYFNKVTDLSSLENIYREDRDYFSGRYRSLIDSKILSINVDFRDDNNIRLGG